MANTLTKEERVAFFEKAAPLAMEHQIKYGIPASVTLAQLALESGCNMNAQSPFGIKTDGKGQKGVDYFVAHDDTPHDKFKKYDGIEAAFEDHSRLLVKGKPYASLRTLGPTDYQSWTEGIKKCGYATDKKYTGKLNNYIEQYNLSKYDQQALEMAKQRGVECGYARAIAGVRVTTVGGISLDNIQGGWHMPLDGDMRMTGDIGENRTNHKHQGIDIGVPIGTPLYATEDNGKIIKTAPHNGNAGNMIVVKYDRPDGKSYQVTYMHLDSIDVKKDDIVNAGAIIGKTGNTGKGSGPHLHMEVRDEKGNLIDPKSYLAEIAVRGDIAASLKKDGVDLLPTYKAEFHLTKQNNLLAEEDKTKKQSIIDQLGQSAGGGDLVSMLFSLMVSKMFDVLALKEMAEAEKRKNGNETEISAADQQKYKSEGIDPKAASRMASSEYESISLQNSQSQTQRVGIV